MLHGEGYRHVVGAGDTWQGVVTCGRGSWHVAGCGLMWQGWGHVMRARAIWQGEGWEHVARVGDMWQAMGSCDSWWGISQGLGAYVKCQKVKMLTMNEVHKIFNLTQ